MNIENYWNEKIIEWENSIKGVGKLSPMEKLASYFRGPLKFRSEACLNLLAPFVKDKKVLEVGCGSGYFAFELQKHGGPKHVTGVDISGNAIQRARQIAAEQKLSDKFTFETGDAVSAAAKEADVMVGLGLLDYLTTEEVARLFSNMKSPYFLFTFSEKQFSIFRYIHVFYLWSQKCPKHFYSTKAQMRQCIGDKKGTVKFVNDPRLSFACIVHNLPS